eukprot:TRINITY_DN12393_c0_g1_i2.p1 TRINITY_DN12393_c0_g1~~TRINITY_DN12393_c0_g1_i2.p1  ORF type:complete len:193 (+),score=74.17 TRINITY_DN12393_c0_g1_i2:260-838(+)
MMVRGGMRVVEAVVSTQSTGSSSKTVKNSDKVASLIKDPSQLGSFTIDDLKVVVSYLKEKFSSNHNIQRINCYQRKNCIIESLKKALLSTVGGGGGGRDDGARGDEGGGTPPHAATATHMHISPNTTLAPTSPPDVPPPSPPSVPSAQAIPATSPHTLTTPPVLCVDTTASTTLIPPRTIITAATTTTNSTQ